jgi:hypothetical protein
MNRRYLSSKRRCNRRTSWYTGETLCTIGWTDSPSFSSVGRVAEEEQRRQQHRMIRRSEWGHRRTIRRLVWIHTETRQDEAFSTGWSDAWSRWSVGLSDGWVKANRGDLDAGSSAPDDPMHRQCIASEQLCQKRHVRWRQQLVAPDEPTPGKR